MPSVARESRDLGGHLGADRLAERDAVENPRAHRAKSTARVSRITTTLICPGYWSSSSILRAIVSESSVGGAVVDPVGRHDHADLAPRLDHVALLHALEAVGDLLQPGEPLHVGLERLAPGARAASR